MFRLRFDNDCLMVFRNGTVGHVQVRGAAGYAVAHNPNDPLHQFMDQLDPATVSHLFADDVAVLNPNNTRHAPSFAACARLFQENR